MTKELDVSQVTGEIKKWKIVQKLAYRLCSKRDGTGKKPDFVFWRMDESI